LPIGKELVQFFARKIGESYIMVTH